MDSVIKRVVVADAMVANLARGARGARDLARTDPEECEAAISCDGVMHSFLLTLLAVLCSFLPRIKSVVFRRL